jgi:hypothetical protein
MDTNARKIGAHIAMMNNREKDPDPYTVSRAAEADQARAQNHGDIRREN